MTLPYPIAPSQTDAKSPVDDNLMDSIRENLNYLDQLLTQGGAPVYNWNVNGALTQLAGRIAKRIDMQFLHVTQQFTRVRIAQGVSGTGGKTEIDVRYHSTPKTPITQIIAQLSQNTNSIAQIMPNLSTQSISRATGPVATQSISRPKGSLNVLSIISLGANLWRYNLSSSMDADYSVGDSILIEGCTAGGNNGTFLIVEKNQSGFASVVVTNAAGVAQTGPVGTVKLQLFSYNLVNPADSQFVPGEPVVMTSHTNGLSNGTKTIFAINQGGNNVLVKDATGVEQGAAAGAVDTARWKFSYSTTVGLPFAVGEFAQLTGHTSGANNINAEIKALNLGGNNIVVVNAAGVAQGAAAGVLNSKRFKYVFSSNPSSDVSIGDSVVASSHTNPVNNGTFAVVAINDVTSDNIVIHNPLGVVQTGVAGQINSVRKLVKFSSDQSLIYSTDSYVEFGDVADTNYNEEPYRLPYLVKQVNRGGGANYNIVIEEQVGGNVPSPSGVVKYEARSIFVAADGSKPQLSADVVSSSANGLLKSVYEAAAFKPSPIPQQTYLGLYILSIQDGYPRDLSVMLT